MSDSVFLDDAEDKRKLVAPLIIEGAKKGGGGDAPEEDPDTLRSRATAKILGALCEGPVEGFAVSSGQSVFLNDTPLQSLDGSSNFGTGLNVNFRRGTQDQSSIPGFDDVRVEQSVGVKVTRQGGATSVTTASNLFSQIIVRIGVASLFRVEDDGDIKGTSVEFVIRIIDNNGTTIVNQTQTISGKARGPVDFEYPFNASGQGPWVVRVTRNTDDPRDLKYNNDLYFKAVIGVLAESFRYPNTALVGLTVSAEAFDSIPELSVEIKGLQIRVPSNYNPASRTYSGIWDGTFSGRQYSNNPVWVFYDLLTNRRYGCGNFVEQDNIDKFALYEISRYCDELVSNGRGGTEPRFTFNGVINNRAEAYEVLNGLASCFQGMIYFANGTIVATQDKPGRAVKLFNSSNVIQEVEESGQVTGPPFTYEGTGRKARKTVALVSWNDPSDRYRGKIEYVEDRGAIQQYGYREISVRGFGCTSQAQAQRIGRWTLLTNLTEKETVTFKVSAQGFFLMPGDLVDIADSDRSGGIAAGICPTGSTTTRVELDRQVVLSGGTSYTLQLIAANAMTVYSGTTASGVAPASEDRAVATTAGTHTALTVSSAFTSVPTIGTAWFLRANTVTKKRYRVISLAEDDGIVTIIAASHNEDKYSIVDNSTALDTIRRSVASLTVTPRVSAGGIVLDVS